MSRICSHVSRAVVLALVGGSALAACATSAPGPGGAAGGNGDGAPAPRTATAAELRAHVDSLRFAAESGRSAERRMTVGECPNCAPGPRVRLEPFEGAGAYSTQELAGGRVIGRFINLDTTPLPGLGLSARDTVYWFVQQSADGWRSILRSLRAGGPVTEVPCGVSPNSRGYRAPVGYWDIPGAGDGAPHLRAFAGDTVAVICPCNGLGCCRVRAPK